MNTRRLLPFVLATATLALAPHLASAAGKGKRAKLCHDAKCEAALTDLNRLMSAEVAAAGRDGMQILLRQANEGRYRNSKINAEIATVHQQAGSGRWYLLHAKRTAAGGVEVQAINALKAKPGAAAKVEIDGMALQLADSRRPDMQAMSLSLAALVNTLPKAPATMSEAQLPRALGGSALLAIVGLDASNHATLTHFAVVPDVIDVRIKGQPGSSDTAIERMPTPNDLAVQKQQAALGNAAPKLGVIPAGPKLPAAAPIAPTPAAEVAKGKEEKLKGQIISSKPGETIILVSDEQGHPKNLRFDIDPAVLEASQKAAAGK